MSKEKLYHIEREDCSKLFLRIYDFVGYQLQKEMKKISAQWIKPFFTTPSFEHMTFSYTHQVFCLLINVFDDSSENFTLSVPYINRLVDASEKNNLIPCIYTVRINGRSSPNLGTLRPLYQGWNLVHAVTQKPINAEELGTDIPTPMSTWEINDFAIQSVRNYLQDSLKVKILAYQNIVGIDPQIWFEDTEGHKNWIIVRYFIYPRDKPETVVTDTCSDQLAEQANARGHGVFGGYLANVGFFGRG